MAMRSIALGGLLVVFFSVLSALTLLPALLGVLGPRVDALRLFWRARTRRGPVLAPLVDVGHAIIRPVSDRDHRAVLVHRLAGAEHRGRCARGRDAAHERRVAAGVRTSCRSVRPAAHGPIQVVLTWEGDPDPLAPANLERLAAFGAESRRCPAWPG